MTLGQLDALPHRPNRDIGIAMSHFDLAAKEAGLVPRFVQNDPGIVAKDGEAYVASFEF